MINNEFANDSIKAVIKAPNVYTNLIFLRGILNQNMVNSSISLIEGKLKNLSFSKTLISKAKLLSVEIMQNVFKHQHSEPTLNPYFYIAFNNEGIKLVSGNSVSIKDFHFLNEKLSQCKTLNINEIKSIYIDRLITGKYTDDGDASLGLLTILKRSNKKSSYTLNKLSENDYPFGLKVTILNN